MYVFRELTEICLHCVTNNVVPVVVEVMEILM